MFTACKLGTKRPDECLSEMPVKTIEGGGKYGQAAKEGFSTLQGKRQQELLVHCQNSCGNSVNIKRILQGPSVELQAQPSESTSEVTMAPTMFKDFSMSKMKLLHNVEKGSTSF